MEDRGWKIADCMTLFITTLDPQFSILDSRSSILDPRPSGLADVFPLATVSI